MSASGRLAPIVDDAKASNGDVKVRKASEYGDL